MQRIVLLPAFFLFNLASAQTPICSIQGSGTSSPYNGQAVTTTGIVTAIFSGAGTMQGFHIEDPNCDGSTATSNGIFVYNPNTSGISVGDRISVSATVQEFQTLTELYSVSNITVIGSGTITPTDLSFPLASAGVIEQYEGMLVRIPGYSVVTGNDEWLQYGELVISAPTRLLQPTQIVDPNDVDPNGTTVGGLSNVSAVNAQEMVNALSSIILDDGRTTSWPDPPFLMGPEGTLRCGSMIPNLTAVMHYLYDTWRLEPAGVIPIVHSPRPAPPLPDADMRIACWNVKNFWSSLGGFGAANAGELDRQRTKLVAALEIMNADAFVLAELQNNDIAWVDLITSLNAAYGFTAYVGIEADDSFGTKSVIFYKPDVLTPVTQLYSLYTSTFERAHITQGFEVNTNGARFLLSGVHLRSKLCDNATGANLDLGDGQGCFNARRIDQAVELATHWAQVRSTTGISAQLVMGDFNSYLQEDPIDMLRTQGFIDLVPYSDIDYSFRYENTFGAIDHALGTQLMSDAVTGAEPWAINADEPPDFDYPDANIEYYQPDPYRSSDHDPLMVGIDVSILTGLAEATTSQGPIRFNLDRVAQRGAWSGDRAFSVELHDEIGRQLSAPSSASLSHAIDLNGLPHGAYTWSCMLKDGAVVSGRFVL